MSPDVRGGGQAEPALRAVQPRYGDRRQVLNEGEFERRRDRLDALSDGQLVFALLTCNDVARRATRGRVREMIEHEAFALIAALERFAPQALERGLALYEGELSWAEG